MSTSAATFDWTAAVHKMTETFEKACNDKDVATIGNMYKDDALLLPPYSPIIRGRKNIEQYMKDFFFKGAADADIKVLEVKSFGDIAYEIGEWLAILPLPDGGTKKVPGKYCVIWQRQPDGNIKVLVDNFSNNE